MDSRHQEAVDDVKKREEVEEVEEVNGVQCLVTGASGYIAGWLVKLLLSKGFAVRGTVRRLADKHKYEHLVAIARTLKCGDRLSFVECNLNSDEGWDKAVAGCEHVYHTASPFPAASPKDEDELIRPAVDGTVRVLKACAEMKASEHGALKRVVLTSSVASISSGHGQEDQPYNEEHWSVLDQTAAYEKSKTMAEKAAWDFVWALPEKERFELTVINPGYVQGPLLCAKEATSHAMIKRLMNRADPGCVRLHFPCVDVRDVALAHFRAMTTPKAAMERYVTVAGSMWHYEIAELLDVKFGPKGYSIPTTKLPFWVMWVVGRFDNTVRMVLPMVNKPQVYANDKATRDLRIEWIPVHQSICDMAQSLIDRGMLSKSNES